MQQWDLVKAPKRNEISYIEQSEVAKTLPLSQLEWDTGLVTLENPIGNRIPGYLTAPQTGAYQFWLYGNDYVEFWLSPNDSPFLAKRIAFNPVRNFFGAYEEFSGQSSRLIELQAGDRYYFDILHYGNTIRNFFSIAWQYGSLAQPSVIQGAHISSFAWDPEDLDDDGLSDEKERLYGIDAMLGVGTNGRLGDFDGDRLSNFWELQRGTDPSKPNAFPKRSRARLFPEVANIATKALNNWTLAQIGRLNQHDAFE